MPRQAHQVVRSSRRQGQRAPPDGPPRDLIHRRLLRRSGESRLQYPRAQIRSRGKEGLPRGSPSRVQCRSLSGHRGHLPHLLPRSVKAHNDLSLTSGQPDVGKIIIIIIFRGNFRTTHIPSNKFLVPGPMRSDPCMRIPQHFFFICSLCRRYFSKI